MALCLQKIWLRSRKISLFQPLQGKYQDQIKLWRASGFFKPLEAHEANLVERLTKVADELFEIVAGELARTREAANDEIVIWPEAKNGWCQRGGVSK